MEIPFPLSISYKSAGQALNLMTEKGQDLPLVLTHKEIVTAANLT